MYLYVFFVMGLPDHSTGVLYQAQIFITEYSDMLVSIIFFQGPPQRSLGRHLKSKRALTVGVGVRYSVCQ